MRTSLVALLLLAVGSRALAAGVVLPLPAEDQQTIAALLGPNVVGRALPSEPIQDASLYFPLVERTHLYRKLKQLGIRPSSKGEDVAG